MSHSDSTPEIVVTDGVEHEEQESVRIVTPSATWYYHKAGAGFASLEDRDGRDWIGYHPGGRAAGEFRGIPNLVNPEGYFHPGGTECATEIVQAGPDKAVLESQAEGGKWRVRWEITPDAARLTVLAAPKVYWFLYEGTPGGKIDEHADACLLSDGRTISAGERWDTRLACPRWVAFRDGASGMAIAFVHHDDDGDVDSYWPMEHNMTVFGFGRLKLVSSLRKTPARFTVALLDAADEAALRARIAELAAREG
jgi:hypothetical protein